LARYHFNLCAERISREIKLGKNKKHVHADLKKEGLFDYSYVSFDKYFKEQKTSFESSSKTDLSSKKQPEIKEGIPKEKETTVENNSVVEIEQREDDEEKDLTKKYI